MTGGNNNNNNYNNNNNNNSNNKRICKIVDFAVPADHRLKLKEWGEKVKYIDVTVTQTPVKDHQLKLMWKTLMSK